MSLQKYETHKLFYGKYFYKLGLYNNLGHIFREKNLSFARQILDKLQNDYENGELLSFSLGMRVNPVQEETFLEAKKLYKFFSKADDYMLRIERGFVCVYSNDKNWINKIIQDLKPGTVREFYEPLKEDFDLLSSNTIIVNHSNGYEYKVTLGNKKGSPEFARWAKNNNKLIKLGPVAESEMLNRGYVANMYFYARDEKTLQLCHLMLDNIRRVDKLVVKSNIDK